VSDDTSPATSITPPHPHTRGDTCDAYAMATSKKQAAHVSTPSQRGGKSADQGAVTRDVGSLISRRASSVFGAEPRSF